MYGKRDYVAAQYSFAKGHETRTFVTRPSPYNCDFTTVFGLESGVEGRVREIYLLQEVVTIEEGTPEAVMRHENEHA
jgi:hypothetical protein